MAPGKKRSYWHRFKSWLNFPKFDPLKMMSSNRGVFGINLGRWKNCEHLDKARKDLMGWIKENKINPYVDQVFPYTKVSDAHHYIQDRENKGKVLLSFD